MNAFAINHHATNCLAQQNLNVYVAQQFQDAALQVPVFHDDSKPQQRKERKNPLPLCYFPDRFQQSDSQPIGAKLISLSGGFLH
ncbi:hypothetical protein ACO0LL_28575 [Undibacterium sp. TC4M20W]|uniref:hypothetical protein n=1 Tax=Undibacterium sp. TC4M20W TaxID=3413052 RepID=UPI003BEFF660